MTQKTMQAADFSRKPYAAPEIRVYQVKVTNIFTTSPTSVPNEEYEEVPTSTTSSWF